MDGHILNARLVVILFNHMQLLQSLIEDAGAVEEANLSKPADPTDIDVESLIDELLKLKQEVAQHLDRLA